MATSTYVALDKVTVSNTTTSIVEFANISGSYTDLVIIGNLGDASTYYPSARFNSDATANYSVQNLSGNGSTALADRSSNRTVADISFEVTMSSGVTSNYIAEIMNYSSSSMYKTMLSRTNNAATGTSLTAVTWKNNAPITNVKLYSTLSNGTYFANFANGSIFTLYGIKAEGTSPAPKATGGAIYSDSTYYYHVFGSTGTFTPTQSISADMLVVAGGGGGGAGQGGGGGAGGLLQFTSQSLTATGYTCTVGGGGAGGLRSTVTNGQRGTTGSDSQFGALTLVKGGGGGGNYDQSGTGFNGGSGGGAGSTPAGSTGGSATSGQGNAGGSTPTYAAPYIGGGGGGAGAVGATGGNGTGIGGIGTSAYSSWSSATGTGQLVSGNYYYAGGGGGGGDTGTAIGGAGGGASSGAAATTNTGGGGGGSVYTTGGIYPNAGNGGSGLVIIRYAK